MARHPNQAANLDRRHTDRVRTAYTAAEKALIKRYGFEGVAYTKRTLRAWAKLAAKK